MKESTRLLEALLLSSVVSLFPGSMDPFEVTPNQLIRDESESAIASGDTVHDRTCTSPAVVASLDSMLTSMPAHMQHMHISGGS